MCIDKNENENEWKHSLASNLCQFSILYDEKTHPVEVICVRMSNVCFRTWNILFRLPWNECCPKIECARKYLWWLHTFYFEIYGQFMRISRWTKMPFSIQAIRYLKFAYEQTSINGMGIWARVRQWAKTKETLLLSSGYLIPLWQNVCPFG